MASLLMRLRRVESQKALTDGWSCFCPLDLFGWPSGLAEVGDDEAPADAPPTAPISAELPGDSAPLPAADAVPLLVPAEALSWWPGPVCEADDAADAAEALEPLRFSVPAVLLAFKKRKSIALFNLNGTLNVTKVIDSRSSFALSSCFAHTHTNRHQNRIQQTSTTPRKGRND